MKATESLQEFIDSLRAIDPIHVNRHTQACNWVTPEGRQVFHERTYFPHSPFKPIVESYWSETVYSDRQLAADHAAQFNGKVTECFYCEPENPLWFLAFDNFENASRHALANL